MNIHRTNGSICAESVPAKKVRLSDPQRRVLKMIRDGKAVTPRGCKCSYLTFAALQRLGLIHVETTFASIAAPRGAHAWITDAGKAALQPPPSLGRVG